MNRSLVRSSMQVLLWGVALAVVVALSFGVLVLLFGRLPNEDERGLLVPTLASVAFAALLLAAVHGRVSSAIARATGGDRAAPTDLARSFSSRMSRAPNAPHRLLKFQTSGATPIRARTPSPGIRRRESRTRCTR